MLEQSISGRSRALVCALSRFAWISAARSAREKGSCPRAVLYSLVKRVAEIEEHSSEGDADEMVANDPS